MQGYNQLDIDNEELRLSPFMSKYVKQMIDQDSEYKFMLQIAEFYSQFLVLQYKVNSANDLNKSVVDEIFTESEKEFIYSLTMSDDDKK